MIPKLRPRQVEAVEKIGEAWRRMVTTILLTAPARSGKTTIFCYICVMMKNQVEALIKKFQAHGREYNKPRHILVVAARRDLIDQASRRLSDYGVEHGIIMSGDPRSRPHRLIQVASLQTLRNRPEWVGRFRLVIIDECHASSSNSYQKLIADNPTAYLLGFTATPFRTDGKALGKDYGEMIKISTVVEQVEMGYLVPYRAFCPFTPDTTGMKANAAGDYNDAEAAAIMDKPQLIGDIVTHWLKHAKGRQTIIYAQNVRHSKNIILAFVQAGIKAAHIDANTPYGDRKRIKQGLMDGSITVVCNVGIWTEGTDIPSVSCVVMARLTNSRVFYIQSCSRGMGAYEEDSEFAQRFGMKRDMILLDHAGVTMKFGLLYDQEIEELDREDRKKKESDLQDEDIGIVECPECHAIHRPAKICPECGHIYEKKERHESIVEHAEGHLKEINMASPVKKPSDDIKAAHTVEALQKIAAERGYSPRWAEKQADFKAQTRLKYQQMETYKRHGVLPDIEKSLIHKMWPSSEKIPKNWQPFVQYNEGGIPKPEDITVSEIMIIRS